MSKEIPILFSTEMVQAILAGRKTQTRRVIDPQPKDCNPDHLAFEEAEWRHKPATFTRDGDTNLYRCCYCGNGVTPKSPGFKCRYGRPGDLLYVREVHYAYGWWVKNGKTKTGRQKWKFIDFTLEDKGGEYRYQENPPQEIKSGRNEKVTGWYKRLARFMPKAAARIWLEVTGVRVERLQEISEEDAIEEGIEYEAKHHGWKDYRPGYGGGVFMREFPVSSYKSLWDSINGEESWNQNPWVWVIEFKVLSTTGKP